MSAASVASHEASRRERSAPGLLGRLLALTGLIEADGLAAGVERLAQALHAALGGAGVFVADRTGRLLAAVPAGEAAGRASAGFEAWPGSASRLPDHLAASVMRLGTPACGEPARAYTGTEASCVVPVVGAGRRLGTLITVHPDGRAGAPGDVHRALAYLGATLAGLILSETRAAEEDRALKERQLARSAVRSLSYSELVAVRAVLRELDEDEGLVVTSRVADQAGITRSLVVNALRKLASANAIEVRSMGTRGTYLCILNRHLRAEVGHGPPPRVGVARRRRPA